MASAGAHHRDYAGYIVRARLVRAAANADPTTTCWRCGRRLAEHPPHKTGRTATWQAGHVVDGDNSGPLAPEVSTCNTRAGATLGNLRRWGSGADEPTTSRAWRN